MHEFGHIPGLGTALTSLSPFFALLTLGFTIWMLVDCIREGGNWYWIWIIMMFWGIGALVYFFRYKFDTSTFGRSLFRNYHLNQRIRETKSKIHHVDTAYHYGELGDAYLQQKKWKEAREAYDASLEREFDNFDVRVHLSYALASLGEPRAAWEIMEPALRTKPDYEYGELMWQAARVLTALGRKEETRQLYEQLVARHSYAHARLEYARILLDLGQADRSREVLKRIVDDAPHAPRFQQRRERKWVREARKTLGARA